MFYKHLQGVLSANECDRIIMWGEGKGFEEAPINMGDGTQTMLKHIRNNTRITFTDLMLRIELQEQIQHEIPKEFNGTNFIVMGQFFRLYKYVPGQYFKPHRDGSFKDEYGCESEITVLFYLNDTDGGETILMPYGKVLTDMYIRIQPKKGDVLMFEHNVLHSGEPVNSGEKYVLRTDLFYV